jgi:exodeoxyribonuclease VII small subunit
MKKKLVNNSFEQNISRLEEISASLESDDVGLEEALQLYEEGINLSKTCLTTLKNAELKITEKRKGLIIYHLKVKIFLRNKNR